MPHPSHRSREQGKGITPVTIEAGFCRVVSGHKCTENSTIVIILNTHQTYIFKYFLKIFIKLVEFYLFNELALPQAL